MKIIRHGTQSPLWWVRREVVCRLCRCHFRIGKGDPVKPDTEEARAVIVACPECGYNTALRETAQTEAVAKEPELFGVDESPRFTHDCDRCLFLGRTKTGMTDYDLYFCLKSGSPTVIARWGSDGPNYLAGPAMDEWAKGRDNPLFIALTRARKHNLLPEAEARP